MILVRRFLASCVILWLVASVVLAAWLTRVAGLHAVEANPFGPMSISHSEWKPWNGRFPYGWWYWNIAHCMSLVFLSVVVFGLAVPAFVRFRALGRRAGWAPGVIAVVASLIDVTAKIVNTAFRLQYHTRRFSLVGPAAQPTILQRGLWELAYQSTVPWTILGAWSWIWLSGRWRRPIGWEDRIGRWYGWAWISILIWYDLGWSVLWG